MKHSRIHTIRVLWLIGIHVLCGCACAIAAEPSADSMVFFEQEVRPLLVKHCYECHGKTSDPKGGLSLASRAAIVQGGESGPAAVPGDPETSLLIDAIKYHGLSMPPRGKLADGEIAKLSRWVEEGMPWPTDEAAPSVQPRDNTFQISDIQRKHWSFQPIGNPALPQVSDTAWPAGPIDRFILARLETRGLQPSPPAEKHVLLRRVTFDLTGLPPTPEELRYFLSDDSAEAFSKVVDRLLASPHYGERWGRHWLDVVRYADTTGDASDFPVPPAYLYRNYVIDSFNADKPYDEFIREQIAGDLLANEEPSRDLRSHRIATGYLAISRRFGVLRDHFQNLVIADTIENIGRSMLGLSLGCARCHDHKFDPISTADYYAIYGIFESSKYSSIGCEREKRPKDMLPLVPAAEVSRLDAAHKAELAKLDEEIAQLVPEEKLLAEQFAESPIDALRDSLKTVQAKLNKLKQQRTVCECRSPYEVAYGVTEGTPVDARVQLRGEATRLGEQVPRRWLTLFGGTPLEKPAESGRRELAEWLTSADNPLTARVIVNRVWHYHFGRGLVATTNDFGLRGSSPSHPELLDYLARRLAETGWSLKQLHREILLSRTYQQASDASAAAGELDPQNELLSHSHRRRLDAESLRDAMLSLSGELDTRRGGPHPFPPIEAWSFSQIGPFRAIYPTNQRSVYLMRQRVAAHPFFATFDGADPNASTGERLASTTAVQALYFMNDPFVHTQSEFLAKRILLSSACHQEQLTLLYELALARRPNAAELDRAAQFLATYASSQAAAGVESEDHLLKAWAALSRVVLTSNEFLFLE